MHWNPCFDPSRHYSASIPLWNSRFLSCSSIKGTGSSSSFSRPLAPVKLGHIKRNQAAACLLLPTQLDLPAYVSILTTLIALDIREYSSMPLPELVTLSVYLMSWIRIWNLTRFDLACSQRNIQSYLVSSSLQYKLMWRAISTYISRIHESSPPLNPHNLS